MRFRYMCVWMLLCAAVWVRGETPGVATHPYQPTVSRREADLLHQVFDRYAAEPAEAREMLLEAIASTPECSAALDFSLGNLLVEEEPDAAQVSYRRAIEKFPLFRDARMNLGRLLLTAGDHRGAATIFSALVSDRLATGATYRLLGHAYMLSDLPVSAETAYRHALMLEPDAVETMQGLAKSLLALQRYPEALSLLATCTERRPQDTDAWQLRANAAMAAGQLDDAVVMFETARRLGALAAESTVPLAGLYLAVGQPDAAVRCYREAFSGTTPVAASALLDAAEALMQVGRTTDAEAFLERAMADAQEAAPALQIRIKKLEGRLAVQRGATDEAVAHYRAVLTLDPMAGDVLVALGDLAAAVGETEEAIVLYERAARCPGSEADALVQHALLEVGRQRYARAITLLEAAQRFDPRPHVARYLEQIRRMGPDLTP